MSQLGLEMKSGEAGTKRPKRRSRAAVLVSLLVLMALVAGAGAVVYQFFLRPAPDYPGPGSGSAIVVVRAGEAIPAIGETLQQADVVLSARAFVQAASDDSRARGIQPGSYRMPMQISARAALDVLVDPANRGGVIVIPEGTRATKVAQLAAESTGIPVAEFLSVMENPSALGLPAYAKGKVEGFLFPATYDVGANPTATKVLTDMVTKFKQVAASLDLERRAAALGQTPHGIVTIASIIQAEGRTVEEYGKISRVIYNRLACTLPACKADHIQQRLQMDSTINYAQGTAELDLTMEQLNKDGPYNTHINKGLPPTPIGNPGETAIEAALEPASGDWLYFISAPGFSQFSDTFAQHQEAERKWRAGRE